MNEEIVYKVDTNIIRKAIQDRYGGISNFAAQTKYKEKSVYNWLQTGVMKTNTLFEIAEILEIENLNILKKKEVVVWQN